MAEIFRWKDEYVLGFKEIDEQHAFFHKTLNALHEKVVLSAPFDEIKLMIDSLVEYAEKHFSTEEKYFEEFKWDGRFEHIKRHNELKERLTEFYKRFLGGEDVGVQIVTFLVDWLTLHFSTEDQKYVECFRKNGLE